MILRHEFDLTLIANRTRASDSFLEAESAGSNFLFSKDRIP